MMKKQHIAAAILVFLIGALFFTQAFPQIKKRTLKSKSVSKSSVPVFVQGKLRVRSYENKIDAHFVLKDKDPNGPPIRFANITVNNKTIRETTEPGIYEDSAPVYKKDGYHVDVKIETRGRREIKTSGKFDSLLQLNVTSVFKEQKGKIDVGEPITISWELIPKTREPVDVTILNITTDSIIFQEKNVTHTNQFDFKPGEIPRNKEIKISVEIPLIYFQLPRNAHGDSYIRLQVRTAKSYKTFG
jgi:hypothetical protein